MSWQSPLINLFTIKYPIIQAGMVWVSGAKLAAAAANADILGLIGAGSMDPDLLVQHIKKAQGLTQKSFGVNIPLLYKHADKQIEVALREGVRVFFTSAGSPKKYTSELKKEGCVVVHVTSTPELALKCQDAGCDAVVAEGFEAGGHNGRDEITTLVLIPQVVDALKIPVIAAGGIGDGRAMVAMQALGAAGVQIGSRFVVTQESSAHKNFKQAIVKAESGDTKLSLKKHVPVRLLKSQFLTEVQQLEEKGASKEELIAHLGHGRARAGMLEGDLETGELEIGQISAMISSEPNVSQLLNSLISEYNDCLSTVLS